MIRGYPGIPAGRIVTAAQMQFGVRDVLVMRGIAEWHDEVEERPRRSRRHQTEMAATSGQEN